MNEYQLSSWQTCAGINRKCTKDFGNRSQFSKTAMGRWEYRTSRLCEHKEAAFDHWSGWVRIASHSEPLILCLEKQHDLQTFAGGNALSPQSLAVMFCFNILKANFSSTSISYFTNRLNIAKQKLRMGLLTAQFRCCITVYVCTTYCII